MQWLPLVQGLTCVGKTKILVISQLVLHDCNIDARAHAILSQFKVEQNVQEHPTLKTYPTSVTIHHEDMNHRKTPGFQWSGLRRQGCCAVSYGDGIGI